MLWQEITRLGVPLAFHGTSGEASKDYVSNRFRDHTNFRTLNHASSFPLELMLAMGAMIVGGMLEKFPALRVGFLEGNCGWLPWWLHRLDDQWNKYGGGEFLPGCQLCQANISCASASSALTWMRIGCVSSLTTSATTTSSCPWITRMLTAPTHTVWRPLSP